MELINPALALLTIAFGAFGFLAPRFTMSALDLASTDSTMGLSEMRASVGGLFVAMGIGCLVIGSPWAYLMLGVAYLGAGLGRLISVVLDNPPRRKALIYFAFEAGPAAWLILANL